LDDTTGASATTPVRSPRVLIVAILTDREGEHRYAIEMFATERFRERVKAVSSRSEFLLFRPFRRADPSGHRRVRLLALSRPVVLPNGGFAAKTRNCPSPVDPYRKSTVVFDNPYVFRWSFLQVVARGNDLSGIPARR
jgi:hypothetical protein